MGAIFSNSVWSENVGAGQTATLSINCATGHILRSRGAPRARPVLIDYDDPSKNVYEVTEEWAFHNGHYGTREDVFFLINGIPVLVIECKNANEDEAIALDVDQIRRCQRETRNGRTARQPGGPPATCVWPLGRPLPSAFLLQTHEATKRAS